MKISFSDLSTTAGLFLVFQILNFDLSKLNFANFWALNFPNRTKFCQIVLSFVPDLPFSINLERSQFSELHALSRNFFFKPTLGWIVHLHSTYSPLCSKMSCFLDFSKKYYKIILGITALVPRSNNWTTERFLSFNFAFILPNLNIRFFSV